MPAAPVLIAVPLVSATPPLAEQAEAARAAGADVVELRVDRIGDVAAVAALLAGPRPLPVIVTVRPTDEGGAWAADEAARRALLRELRRYRPEYIDVELAAWPESQRESPRSDEEAAPHGPRASSAPAETRTIVSHHDLAGTPRDLGGVFARLAAVAGADVRKVVFTAHTATDALHVLLELHRQPEPRRWIALAMGEAGLATRVLARKFGALLTFATVAAGGESAPGQPTVAELRGLYGWDRGSPATQVYGVVGWPVAHSQGPLVHNAALAAAGIDGVYLPLPIAPEPAALHEFLDLAAGHAELNVAGLSVTAPHKEAALAWLDARSGRASAAARRCGAVNTLTRTPQGEWHGDNTDGGAAVAALQAAAERADLRGRAAAVLGAGGAARAVAAALQDAGCPVTLYNRSPARAAALARDLRCAWQPWAARADYAGEILINCTTLGLAPAVDASPLPAQALRPGTLVLDANYRPARTRLLCDAQARGCVTVSGVEMFVRQAAAQFALWQGRAAPLDVLRGALAGSDR